MDFEISRKEAIVSMENPTRLMFRTDGMGRDPAALCSGFVVVGTEGRTTTNPMAVLAFILLIL
jgi:hypothetical protein